MTSLDLPAEPLNVVPNIQLEIMNSDFRSPSSGQSGQIFHRDVMWRQVVVAAAVDGHDERDGIFSAWVWKCVVAKGMKNKLVARLGFEN